ncbi:MAG: photosynthetic complex assembly protein PuhC [Pseudomonadota bacterium]
MTDFNHHTTLADQQRKLAKRDKEMIPLVLVRAMFGLAIVSVALVAYARLTDRPLVGVPDAPPVVAERTIFMAPGERRGSYVVTDEGGATLVTSTDTRAGFVGAIGQAVERRRQITRSDQSAPLTLVRRDTGRIDIIDDASGLSIELHGYGRDNVAVFAGLLSE